MNGLAHFDEVAARSLLPFSSHRPRVRPVLSHDSQEMHYKPQLSASLPARKLGGFPHKERNLGLQRIAGLPPSPSDVRNITGVMRIHRSVFNLIQITAY